MNKMFPNFFEKYFYKIEHYMHLAKPNKLKLKKKLQSILQYYSCCHWSKVLHMNANWQYI